MIFTNARYLNADASLLEVDVDGIRVTVPASLDNATFATLSAGRVPIAVYRAPAPSAGEVQTEARRRMAALLGARDEPHLDLLIANDTREAVRLLMKGVAAWTPEEKARAERLTATDHALEQIQAASEALEAAPPADFRDDRNWPAKRAKS